MGLGDLERWPEQRALPVAPFDEPVEAADEQVRAIGGHRDRAVLARSPPEPLDRCVREQRREQSRAGGTLVASTVRLDGEQQRHRKTS